MSNELRRCPYCGTVPQVIRHDDLNTDMDGYNVWVGCCNWKCDAQGPTVSATVSEFGDYTDTAKDADVKAAIAAWNRRDDTPGVPAMPAEVLESIVYLLGDSWIPENPMWGILDDNEKQHLFRVHKWLDQQAERGEG